MNWKFHGLVCFGTAAAICAACTIEPLEFKGEPFDGGDIDIDQPSSDAGKQDAPTSGTSVCERACAKMESANCSRKSSCVSDCEADLNKVPTGCKPKATSLIECAATKGTEFTCNSEGKATVSKGCDPEGNALVECILKGPADGSAGACPSGETVTRADLDAEIGFRGPVKQSWCSGAELAKIQDNFSNPTLETWFDLGNGVSEVCRNCVVSADTNANWQVIVGTASDNGQTGFINWAACYASILGNACGKAIQYAEFCQTVACGTCSTTEEGEACRSNATTGTCKAFYDRISEDCSGGDADGADSTCSNLGSAIAYLCGS